MCEEVRSTQTITARGSLRGKAEGAGLEGSPRIPEWMRAEEDEARRSRGRDQYCTVSEAVCVGVGEGAKSRITVWRRQG